MSEDQALFPKLLSTQQGCKKTFKFSAPIKGDVAVRKINSHTNTANFSTAGFIT